LHASFCLSICIFERAAGGPKATPPPGSIETATNQSLVSLLTDDLAGINHRVCNINVNGDDDTLTNMTMIMTTTMTIAGVNGGGGDNDRSYNSGEGRAYTTQNNQLQVAVEHVFHLHWCIGCPGGNDCNGATALMPPSGRWQPRTRNVVAAATTIIEVELPVMLP
jgi:hypothetical protein